MSKKWIPEPLFDPVDSLVLGMERLGKTKTKKKKYLTFSERLKKYNKSRAYKESLKNTSVGRLDDKHVDLDELNEIIRHKKKYNRSRKKKKHKMYSRGYKKGRGAKGKSKWKSRGKSKVQRGGRRKRLSRKKTKRRR